MGGDREGVQRPLWEWGYLCSWKVVVESSGLAASLVSEVGVAIMLDRTTPPTFLSPPFRAPSVSSVWPSAGKESMGGASFTRTKRVYDILIYSLKEYSNSLLLDYYMMYKPDNKQAKHVYKIECKTIPF